MRRPVLLLALLAGFVVLLVAVETRWGPLHHLDADTAHDLNDRLRRASGEVTFWRVVSDVLDPYVLRAVALVAVVLLWWRARRDDALLVALAMIAAAVVEAVVKAGVGRHRPSFPHPVASASGASFPSGHALTSIVAFGLLVVLVPRWAIGVASAVAVLLVGFSRLALGVHYVSDVLAGWLLGGAVLVAAQGLVSGRSARRSGREVPDPPRGT